VPSEQTVDTAPTEAPSESTAAEPVVAPATAEASGDASDATAPVESESLPSEEPKVSPLDIATVRLGERNFGSISMLRTRAKGPGGRRLPVKSTKERTQAMTVWCTSHTHAHTCLCCADGRSLPWHMIAAGS